jgi:hypothetical protein
MGQLQSKVVLNEKDKAYVDVTIILLLKDNSFIWTSEKTVSIIFICMITTENYVIK